eukprot:TRINITY_DN20855_c0_g1_i1.p1 TRINITY_DN20855_c0_g1~~TRINITY_DN20855_c0_g1_i1.p1  ORF type:complete len:334 (+),score=89.31 TRINITY_DN20855_c0_g1_i1:20-1021(+)
MAAKSDALGRLIDRRIRNVEQHFKAMDTALYEALRTEIKLADRWDAFAEAMTVYSEVETPGVRDALKDYANMVKAMQASRREMQELIQLRLSEKLKTFPGKYKDVKSDLTTRERLRVKRLAKEGALDRARARDPTNSTLLKRYKNELAGAKSEEKSATRTVCNSMMSQERRKLDVIRDAFRDMLEAQIGTCCRQLEELSRGQLSLDIINADEDLQELTETARDEKENVDDSEHYQHHRDDRKSHARSHRGRSVDSIQDSHDSDHDDRSVRGGRARGQSRTGLRATTDSTLHVPGDSDDDVSSVTSSRREVDDDLQEEVLKEAVVEPKKRRGRS